MKRQATREHAGDAGTTINDNSSRATVVINLRATVQARDLIDSAAEAEGKNRTEFMLDSALRRAQEVLLEKRVFMLPPERYDAMMRLLESPGAPSSGLKRLLLGKAPWESD